MGKLARKAVKKAGCAGKADGKAGCDMACGEGKGALACPVCGAELAGRNGRFGEFYGRFGVILEVFFFVQTANPHKFNICN